MVWCCRYNLPDINGIEFLDELTDEQGVMRFPVIMLNGSSVYIMGNMVGTFDEDGSLVKFRGYLFDNTEQHRLADQLQQAQKLESIGLLVSGIAHDFNNMLGGILGYASRGLAHTTEGEPLREPLERIQNIATRATKMTQQLLAFSRR